MSFVTPQHRPERGNENALRLADGSAREAQICGIRGSRHIRQIGGLPDVEGI
jgi:hypothetical protein